MVEVVFVGEHAAGVDFALEHRVEQSAVKYERLHVPTSGCLRRFLKKFGIPFRIV